jgi:hypothetical protein
VRSPRATQPYSPRARSHAVGGQPPIKGVKGESDYDKETVSGKAAFELVTSWAGGLDAALTAPWRQTTGEGGRELGTLKWLKTICKAWDLQEPEIVVKDWQLAVADLAVRWRQPHTRTFTDTRPRTQAETLAKPNNKRAIGGGKASGRASTGSGVQPGGASTEPAVKEWMKKLKQNLQGKNPMPITFPATDTSPESTWSISIKGFAPNPAAALPPPAGEQAT